MADTAQIVIDRLQARMPDVTPASAILYINRVHRLIVSFIPNIARKRYDIAPALGTANYDLNADCIEVYLVQWQTALGTATELKRTTLDKLVEENSGWDFDANATPTEWYLAADVSGGVPSELKIVVHPKPPANPVGGYPNIRVSATEATTLLAATALPDGLATYDVYLEGACYYAAEELKGAGGGDGYWQRFMFLLDLCDKRFNGMIPQIPETATYPIKRPK